MQSARRLCEFDQHAPFSHLLSEVQGAAHNRSSTLDQLIQSLPVPL